MRRTLRMLAAACALTAIATLTPQVASAAPVVNSFKVGDIVKMKTTWGGGWVLNLGGPPGSTTVGRIAEISGNVPWDYNNRFEVIGETAPQGGLRWFRLQNRFSKLCLTASSLSGGGTVTQQKCDLITNRYWAVVPGPAGTVAIRNLAFHQFGLDMILTQQTFESVGSHITMERPPTNTVDYSRQRWIVQTCKPNGPELRDC